MNAIYEEDFLGFSYGFRPGRSPHQALDALTVGITTKKVNWVLDADIRDFFGSLTHEWLVKFVEHRIGDKRVVRLIQKWLAAGVLEDGKRVRSEVGTVQGGSVSPLLANIYLHYVLDLWAQQWRKTQAQGDMVIVRFADDFVVGFEHRQEPSDSSRNSANDSRSLAWSCIPTRHGSSNLAAMRTRIDETAATGNRRASTFWASRTSAGKTRKGWFTVLRQTMRQRWQAKVQAVRIELKRRLHDPVPEVGAYLRSVVTGHYRYYGVPMNGPALGAFRNAIALTWRWMLRRRSQKSRMPWSRFAKYAARWLPHPRICHPYPLVRFAVTTQGKSRMR